MLFSECFYTALFQGNTLGRALLSARKSLYAKRDQYGSLWAAYQHYGEPDEKLRKPQDEEEPKRARGRPRKSRARR